MLEEWVEIVGYSDYMISNHGRVWGRRYNRILKPQADRYGYLFVNLYRDGKAKSVKVHRLVASHFICFIPEVDKELSDYHVNHRDEDKTNNNVTNLEFITCKANVNYGTANRRRVVTNQGNSTTPKKVICVETGEVFSSIREAARHIGRANNGIMHCCKGKRKKCGGYQWRYLEGGDD